MRTSTFCQQLLLTSAMSLSGAALAAPPPVADCTMDMETVCPDTEAVCTGRFLGSGACVVEGLANCYSSGVFAYEIPAGENMTIRFAGEVNELSVFFASEGAGLPGRMRFFDANGLQVPGVLSSNGDCTVSMPPLQTIQFPTPVRTVRVRASDTPVFIDDLRVNPAD